MKTQKPTEEAPEDLMGLAQVAELMDNRFRIPGTQLRFGLDSILGLFPYLGDVVPFLISGYLVLVMSRKGASGMLVVKMIGNILLDGILGTIPLLGDLFDWRYRANIKNVNLLLEHYEEDQHQGSAWWVILLLTLVILAMAAFSVYVVWRILYWIVT
jgi:hypothetical protein